MKKNLIKLLISLLVFNSLFFVLYADDNGDKWQDATTYRSYRTNDGELDERDKDYFKFTVPVDGLYKIYTTGSTDTVGTLLDWQGNYLDENDDNHDYAENNNFYLTRRMIEDEVYYIQIAGYNEYTTGYYVLMIEKIENNNNVNFNIKDATNIYVGSGGVSSKIRTSGDKKYFKFLVPSSDTYKVYTSGTTDTVGSLLDWKGSELGIGNDDNRDYVDGNNFYFTKQMIEGEVYFVEVSGYGNETGDFTLYIQRTSSNNSNSNNNNNTSSAFEDLTLIENGDEISSRISYSGDINYYKFVVPESGIYKIYTTGSTDTVGKLLDWRGNELGIENDDSKYADESNFCILQHMVEGEAYYIEVSGYGERTGIYTLNINQVDSNSYYSSYRASNNVRLQYIKTFPTQIHLKSQENLSVINSNYNNAINGCYFSSDDFQTLNRIAIVDDNTLVTPNSNYMTDELRNLYNGTKNLRDHTSGDRPHQPGIAGTFVFDGTSLMCDIQTVTEYNEIYVIDRSNYWAIGGVNMYLNRSDIKCSDLAKDEGLTRHNDLANRTGLVYDKDGYVWGITSDACTSDAFRKAIIEMLEEKVGRRKISGEIGDGIFLDGGGSTQMKYNGETKAYSSRLIPLIIVFNN